MSVANMFLKPINEYERNHDIIGNYSETAIKHLSAKFGKSEEYARNWLKNKMEKEIKPVDPVMEVTRRDGNGDRYKTKTTLTTFLNWVDKNELVLGPNMVVYENYNKQKSFVAEFVVRNLKKRKATKGLMAEYFARGDKEKGQQANLLQANYKLFNNSISGATSSPHNPMFYSSSHTTLTSICRSCTSFANASNEKLLGSNRPYFTLDDALANISDVAIRADLKSIAELKDKYNLNAPTVEYVTGQVMESIRLYNNYNLDKMENSVRQTLSGMTDIELMAISFVGDLNAFKDVNNDFLKVYFDGFLVRPTVPAENPDAILKSAYEDITILTSLLNTGYMKGIDAKKLKETDPHKYGLYAAHVEAITNHLNHLSDFIHTFVSTPIVPQNLHSVPEMTRRVVVGSDTDSSIFSTERLVVWYTGNTQFSKEADEISAITAFTASQVVANAMVMLSKQMGVRDEEIYRIAMKSEYFMPVLALSNSQKHYVYLEGAKESNVYKKETLATKGVQFKNSRLPNSVMDLTNDWYYDLLMQVRNNRKLTPQEIMAVPAFVEHSILESISAAKPDLFMTAKVKPKGSYAKPWSLIWAYSNLWQEVFAVKYGAIDQFPCSGVKINVALKNKREVTEWAATLAPQMGRDLLAWCEKNKKWSFTQMFVPQHMAMTGSIPKEMVPIVDINKVISTMTGQYYLFMSTFGIQMGDTGDWVSNTLTKEEAMEHSLLDLSSVTFK